MKKSASSRRVALGLSGGVDSAVSAWLLREQGYQVETVFLECWNEPGCRTDQDRKDALAVAIELNMPFQVLDFRKEYRQRVLSYFLDEYRAGRTPNPDIICNREIKFGLFYDWAMAQGFDAIATGHYAKLIERAGLPQLAIPADTHKDQTYFLSQVKQTQLNHVLFPLANLTKAEVRQLAKSLPLPNAEKKDSVGICFIGDINVRQFLRDQLGENPGEVIDIQGNSIGHHHGLWFYTIGQRHGFTINQTSLVKSQAGELVTKHNIPPFYVIGKNSRHNQLIVGFGAETTQDYFTLSHFNWLASPPISEKLGTVHLRLRHGGDLLPCHVDLNFQSEKLSIALKQALPGISPGQFGVLYQILEEGEVRETICLGGGIIDESIHID